MSQERQRLSKEERAERDQAHEAAMTKSAVIVLSTGGYTGVLQIRPLQLVADWCWKHGIKVVRVVGASVGAVNAFTVAQAQCQREVRTQTRRAARGWGRIGRAYKFKHQNLVFPHFDLEHRVRSTWKITDRILVQGKPSLLPNDSLRALVRGTMFPDLNKTRPQSERAVTSPIHLDVCVLDKTTGAPTIVSTRDADIQKDPAILLEFVEASAAVQFIFEPVYVKSRARLYSDCGSIMLDTALEENADVIFVLCPYARTETRRVSAVEALQGTALGRRLAGIADLIETISDRNRENDLREIRRAKEVAATRRALRMKAPEIVDVFFHDAPRTLQLWSFGKDDIRGAMQSSHAYMANILQELTQKLGFEP